MRKATTSGIMITSGLFVMRLSGFAISVMVARIVGANTFGEYTLFLSLFHIVSDAPHAFDTAYFRFTGISDTNSQTSLFESTNVFAKFVFTIVFVGLFFSLSNYINFFMHKENAGNICVWAAACGGLHSLYNTLPTKAQQRHEHRDVALLKPLYNIAVLVVISVFLLLKFDMNMRFIISAYFITGIVFGGYSLITNLETEAFKKKNRSLVISYYRLSGTLIISTIISLFGNKLDVFLINRYLDYESLGIYGAALRISVIVSIMTATMSTIILPMATDATTYANKFRRYIALGGFYSICQTIIAVILLIFLESIIVIIFGSAYRAATFPAALLILRVLFLSVGVPYQALLQCGSKPGVLVYISIGRILVSVPFLLYLIPKYGINGAAGAITLSTLFMTSLMFVISFKARPLQ